MGGALLLVLLMTLTITNPFKTSLLGRGLVIQQLILPAPQIAPTEPVLQPEPAVFHRSAGPAGASLVT